MSIGAGGMSHVVPQDTSTIRKWLETYSEDAFRRENIKVPENFLDKQILAKVYITSSNKSEYSMLLIDNDNLFVFCFEEEEHHRYGAHGILDITITNHIYVRKIITLTRDNLKHYILDEIDYKRSSHHQWNIVYTMYEDMKKEDNRKYLD